MALHAASGPALVGRSVEIGIIQEVIDIAAEGRSAMLALEGEAGIGKSRLISEAIGLAEQRGFVVLAGGADELDADVPFRALREALGLDARSVQSTDREELALLLGTRRTLGPGEEVVDISGAVVDATLDAIERLTLLSPTLFVLDDLQWADPLTLRVLASLARRLVGVPLAVIVAYRPVPRPADLDRALDALTRSGGNVVRLDPLTDDAATELAAGVIGRTVGPQLARRLTGASGNALYVIELVRALQADGAISVRGEVADTAATDLPSDMRMTLVRRVGTMPAATIRVLRSASVLGSTFSLSDLVLITGSNLNEVIEALDPAIQGGFIHEAADRLAFRHDLIREAVYADFPQPIRKALHMEAARALSSSGRPPAQVAEHYLLGAEAGDESAARFVLAAAEDVIATSPRSAMHMLRRGLVLVPPGSDLHDEMVALLVWIMPAFGEATQAEHLAREVLARRPSGRIAARLHGALSHIRGIVGDLSGTLRHCRLAAEAEDDLLRKRWYLDIANGMSVFVDAPGAESYARDALSEAIARGDVAAEALHEETLARVELMHGRCTQARSHAARSVELYGRSDVPWAPYAQPHFWLAVAELGLDDLASAREAIRNAQRAAESYMSSPDVYGGVVATLDYISGEWSSADVELQALHARVAEGGGNDAAMTGYAVAIRLALHRGDEEAADLAVSRANEVLSATGVTLDFNQFLCSQALLLERRQGPEPALNVLGACWDIEVARYFPSRRLVAADLVRLAIACGDRERAARVVDEVAEAERRTPVPTTRALANLCRGMLCDDEDDLAAAVEAYRHSPCVPNLAQAAEIAGTTLARKDRSSGRLLLQEALDIWERLGANAEAVRVAALLGTKRRRRRAAKATVGWGALSPAELAVTRLVAEGLTNKQAGERLSVSRRTIETHLAHIFAKLSASSRSQVAAIAARQLMGEGQ